MGTYSKKTCYEAKRGYEVILLEYEAKKLLADFLIPVPFSQLVDTNVQPTLPVVIKSQVPVGGRGKAGGIAVVYSKTEYDDAVAHVSKLPIKGHLPKVLLAEQVLEIDKEFYVAIRLNTAEKRINIVAHPHGGVDVEENTAGEFYIRELTRGTIDRHADMIADLFGIAEKSHIVGDIIAKLYDCFIRNDALLLEINPFVLTKSGDLIAADCKMEVDNAALFRHQDWGFETKPTNANFVTLNNDGNVATIANGAGLAMATVDAVASVGLVPANFLDVGGGANEASVLAAFKEIMRYPNVKVILINIFAGITRCDEVAKAIIAARKKIDSLPPLSIRLAGTNHDEAKRLLDGEGIDLLPTLAACLKNAKEHTS